MNRKKERKKNGNVHFYNHFLLRSIFKSIHFIPLYRITIMLTHKIKKKKKTSLRFHLTAIVTVLLVDQWMKSIELYASSFPASLFSHSKREREKSEQTLLSTTIRLEQTFSQTGSWYYGHQQPQGACSFSLSFSRRNL